MRSNRSHKNYAHTSGPALCRLSIFRSARNQLPQANTLHTEPFSRGSSPSMLEYKLYMVPFILKLFIYDLIVTWLPVMAPKAKWARYGHGLLDKVWLLDHAKNNRGLSAEQLGQALANHMNANRWRSCGVCNIVCTCVAMHVCCKSGSCPLARTCDGCMFCYHSMH